MGLSMLDVARMSPAAQRQVAAKLNAACDKYLRVQKYHNEPDSRGVLHFDSRKEARRYDELLVLLKAGKIRSLRLQQQYTLQESYIDAETGERVRAIRYVADFTYERFTGKTWERVVEDVKSRATKTAQYEMKKKLLHERYGIRIEEV